MEKGIKFKKGAASFYIVAFSTLILVIIATSFATVVLSELVRTANDDLAQSAYDSALAGIEDAKLAYAEYQKCKNGGSPTINPSITCKEIIDLMERGGDCDVVGKILGRYSSSGGSGEVMIEENYSSSSGSTNNMQQAYTCVKINTILNDYSSTLTEIDTMRAVRVRLHNGQASDVKRVKITWTIDEEKTAGNKFDFRFSNILGERVSFPKLKGEAQAARPPMISVGLVQTADEFRLSDFEETDGTATNRGTVFLVPSDKESVARGSLEDNYIGAYGRDKNNPNENVILSSDVVKSNNRAVKNLPFVVYCDVTTDSNCSAILELPDVFNGTRSNETFMILVSNTYGEPKAKFNLEFYDKDSKIVELSGMQIEIDSTGRANNLYRRVMARMEPADTNYPYPLFGIELLGENKNGSLLQKPSLVTCEWDEWSGFKAPGLKGFCP